MQWVLLQILMVVPTSEVGSKETDEMAEEVLKLDILDCWTPDNHYRWSTSECLTAFGFRPSVMIVGVQQSRISNFRTSSAFSSVSLDPTSEVGTSIKVDDLRKETPKSFRRKDLDASEEQLDV